MKVILFIAVLISVVASTPQELLFDLRDCVDSGYGLADCQTWVQNEHIDICMHETGLTERDCFNEVNQALNRAEQYLG